jgi:hypothetical protein
MRKFLIRYIPVSMVIAFLAMVVLSCGGGGGDGGGGSAAGIGDAPVAASSFSTRMLSGGIYFEEHNDAGGDYNSSLTFFNGGSSFEQYRYKNPPDTSEHVTGTWSINGSGELILNYVGGKTITVVPITMPELGLSLKVSVDDGTGPPYTVKWERSGPGPYPFRAVLNGTYVNQYGDTWIFNSNGTGSTTGDGGWTFTWSVDDGILKVVFSNGYVGWMYERSTSMYTYYPTTIIRCAFVEYTPTGDFYFYYGGMELTPK